MSMMIKRNQQKHRLLLHFAPSAIFLCWGLSIIYHFNIFELDPDEGINLMKAFLINHGYPLYQEVWNDQPPILTHILALEFSLFEPSVNLARVIILLFSVGLIWQIWLILYLFTGIVAALIGSLLLVISPHYLKLSISVMVGLPCLTLAMAAVLTIILWHRHKQIRWLIASALFLSLSILTKLFTFFLAPIIVLGILVEQAFDLKINNWQEKIQPIALWLIISLSFSSLLVSLFIGYENLELLINNHIYAKSITTFKDITLDDTIRANYKYFLFGLSSLGSFFACQNKHWQMIYFEAWFLTGFWLLSNHKPVWYHQ
jgi:Dolichyl-phosphate-mannose-protein mannosyltransferase